MANNISVKHQMDSNTLVRCRFHHEESCQLYCKECGDFVCFHCLGQFHQKHNFCQIRDAETNIRDEFKSLVLRKEHEIIFNGSSLDRLLGLRDEIEKSIEYHTENRKTRIDMLKKDLLTQLNDTVSSKKTAIQETLDRIENVRLAFLKIDTTNLQELEFWSVVNILTEIKSCLLSANSHKHYLKQFTFKPNDQEISVGQLIFSHGQNNEAKNDEIEKSEHQNPPLCRDVSIQTENQRYSDSKDNSSEANCIEKGKTDIQQKDCNDKYEEYSMFYKISIDRSYEYQHITKIVPISDKNAWIISGNKLHKITNHTLDDKTYAQNVCDIGMLRHECVFIILIKNTKIMQLVNDNRLILFANSGKQPFFPHCACVTMEDTIIVLLLSTVQEDQGYKYAFIHFDLEGVVVRRIEFYQNICHIPNEILSTEEGLYFFYVKAVGQPTTSLIQKRNPISGTVIESFQGVIGYAPENDFECFGISTDTKGNILVSDCRHHCVFILDKNLKYKRRLVNASDGLNNPKSVGLVKGSLWIAVENGIQIFKNEPNVNNSMCSIA